MDIHEEDVKWWMTWSDLQRVFRKYRVVAVFHEELYRWNPKCWHVVIEQAEE